MENLQSEHGYPGGKWQPLLTGPPRGRGTLLLLQPGGGLHDSAATLSTLWFKKFKGLWTSCMENTNLWMCPRFSVISVEFIFSSFILPMHGPIEFKGIMQMEDPAMLIRNYIKCSLQNKSSCLLTTQPLKKWLQILETYIIYRLILANKISIQINSSLC